MVRSVTAAQRLKFAAIDADVWAETKNDTLCSRWCESEEPQTAHGRRPTARDPLTLRTCLDHYVSRNANQGGAVRGCIIPIDIELDKVIGIRT